MKRAISDQQSAVASRRSAGRAFTLIELLAVLVIIGVLAGLILGAAVYASRKARSSRTRAEISAMETALESYKIDNGIYPADRGGGTNGAAALYQALAGSAKKYMTFRSSSLQSNVTSGITIVIDRYGSPYYYSNQWRSNDIVAFDLWSAGPDRVSGTADDITNWKQN